MALLAFVLGVLAGAVLTVLLAAGAAWAVLRTGTPRAPTSASAASSSSAAASAATPGDAWSGVTSAAPEWPVEVVRFLRGMLSEPSTPETSRWLNAVLTRFWLELRVSALYKERMTRKLVSKLRRKLDTAFVRDIDITDLSFGDFPPSVQRIQLVQSTDMNEELLVMVDLDLVYRGGMALTIEVELATVNVQIPVTVTITEIVGRLRIRLPRPQHGTEFNVSFVTEPAFGLSVQSRLLRNQQEYSLFRDRLDAYLTKRLRALFLEMWTQPVWRFFDLPLISLPTYVHPSCKCDLGDGVFRPSAEALGKGFTKSVALFPVTATPTPATAQDMADALVARLLHVAQDNSQDWLTIKSKSGLVLQKNRRRLFTKDDAPFFRGMWTAPGDAKIVAQVLADPELLKAMDVDYEACFELLPTPMVAGVTLRQYSFKKQDYVAVQVAKQVPTTWVPVDMWVVAQRGVQPPLDVPGKVDASKSVRGTVLLYGFLVEAVGVHHTSCQVTCVSQMDPTLGKHNFTFEQLVLLKAEVARRCAGPDPLKPTAPATAVGTVPGPGAGAVEPAALVAADRSVIASLLQRGPSWRWRERSATGGPAVPAVSTTVALATVTPAAPASAMSGLPLALPTPASASDADAGAASTALNGATPALASVPKVTSDNFAAIADETVACFLELARRANDGAQAKPWRPVKRQQPSGLVMERKPSNSSIASDIVRATVYVACPAERAYSALKGSRYRSVAQPDLLACESLVAYDDGTVVRHYRFKGSLLPDRDWVTLDVARPIGPGEWVVVQRSVAASDLVSRSGGVRLVVHIAGYYVHTTLGPGGAVPAGLPAADEVGGGQSSCYITHVMQVGSEGSTFALQWLRYSWAWNLTTIKYALERSVEGGDVSSGLPHVATSKLIEVAVKAGGLVWIAVPHTASPAAGTLQHRLGQLAWEFSTRGSEIKFALVFANNEAPDLLAGVASAASTELGSDTGSANDDGGGGSGGGGAPMTSSVQAVAHHPRSVLLTASGTEVVLPSRMVSLTAKGAADQPAPWEGATHVWSVVPTAVFNSHICPVTGSVNVSPHESGTYYLVFDNRAARFSDAHVVYKAAVSYHHPEGVPDTELDLVADDAAAGASAVTSSPLGGSRRQRGSRQGGASSVPLLMPPLDAHITADVRIGRGEVLRIPLHVFTPAEEVRLVWEFRSGKDEIDFSIVFEPWPLDGGGEPPAASSTASATATTLLEPGRVSTETDAFAGEIHAAGRPGRYYFVWDNRFSRWRTKMIGFSVMVLPSAGVAPAIRRAQAPARPAPRARLPASASDV